MTFQTARCEICNQYQFTEDKIIAYRIKLDNHHSKLELVNLHGQEPWCGIRTVCKPCIEFLKEITK